MQESRQGADNKKAPAAKQEAAFPQLL